MLKRLFSIILMLCVAVPAFAQGRLVAKVVDMETKQGVVGAIVELTSKANPNMRKHNTTGAGGSVTLAPVANGEYTMTIAFIGYTTLTQDITVKGATDLGVVELTSGVAIEAVVKEVQAMRTSQNGDTLAYNAAAFKVAADADVEGLLKKMPGITISNGSVEAQGEQVKKIFVDGKEFFGEDVSTALNSLPAQAVNRVEVFNKLSDNAEFSGMDDGEGYKAINIVTHSNMRQGIFGKVYAGYGYQPDTEGGSPDFEFQGDGLTNPILSDGVTSPHKYNFGGNVNIFQGSSRVSVIGMVNNVNQQNFSFEDIIGVTGGGGGMGGGPGRGVGGYMVRPQSGVARVGSIGVQYSDSWGEKDKVKLNGSYFYNDTNTRNKSFLQKWYEIPSPDDYLEQEGESHSHNFNHRFNARLDWNINKNMSLMSRTSFSFQGNDSQSQQYGELTGESVAKSLPYEILNNGSSVESRALRFSEFLQYRVKLGKDGRTITVDGRYSIRNTPRSETNSMSTLQTILDGEGRPVAVPRYVASFAPQSETDISANFTYTEPVAKNAQVSLQYRFDVEDQDINKNAYLTGSDYSIVGLQPDGSLSLATNSLNMEHRVGPGFRYAKGKNTFVANLFYQYSVLKGNNLEEAYVSHKPTYFVMGNVAFDAQNSIRVFINSYTQNPDVRNLQSIYDVSNAQYISQGNPDLKSAYTHRMNFHYIRSNIEQGRTFMWMFSGQITQNYIGQSLTYNPGEMDIVNPETGAVDTYNPLQYSTYANMDGYSNLRTHVSYGFPIPAIKCNLNLSAGFNWSRTPSMIGDQLNITSNMGYDASLSLGSNISENLDFTVQWNGAYNDATQSLGGKNNRNQYFSHTASGSLKWVFWKGFTLTAAVNYNQYVGFTNDYNEDFLICNVYLGKKLFKNQQAEVLVGVNDLLNQNKAFARSVGSGYTQNAWNSTIGRYFTVQFNYNLRHFGKKGSKNVEDYDGMGGRPGGMPFHGGRPPMMPPR